MINKKICVLIVTLSCFLTACSKGGSGSYPSNYPSSDGYTVDDIMYPEAPGNMIIDSDIVRIDYSNTQQGYIVAALKKKLDKKIKVQVSKDDQKINYDLVNTEDVAFPLQLGDGIYTIKILQNIEGKEYAIVKSEDIEVTLDNPTLPFLYPNQIVNYKKGDKVTTLAIEKVHGVDNDLVRIKTIYEYVMDLIEYDDEKAKRAMKQYILPNLDEIIDSGKGICFDYAALMVAMLRINHIPARLVCGGTDRDGYHAWVEVYLEGDGWINPDVFIDKKHWSLMDPTFSDSKYDYNGNYVATLYY